MSAQTLPVPPQAPAAVATEAASGVPLFVFAFGFSVVMGGGFVNSVLESCHYV